jgi:hypothetical protein
MFSNKIEFIHYDSYKEPVAAAPRPSKYFIPKEFKKLENFLQGDLEKITVKKCIPFLDAYTFGYIIPFDQDYLIKPGKTKEDFEVIPAERLGKGFDSHSNAQLPPEWKGMVGHRAGKFRNQWIIKTAPGYSCLFVHPLNHLLEDRFKILAGVVDTDTYLSIINFPFTLTTKTEQFLLKKGDPMVQVIPFKREAWKMWKGFKNLKGKNIMIENNLWSHWYDKYKNLFWRKKSFK